MSKKKMTAAAAIGLAGMLTSQAQAQSAGKQDAEIALLKQQLRMMEQKLDRLEKQGKPFSAGEAQHQSRRQRQR